jgi:hypothetical protein
VQVKRQAADRSCLNYTRRQLLRGEWLGGLGGGPEIARVKLSLQWRTSPVAYHPVRPASRMLSSRRCSNATSAMLNREPFAEQASDDNHGTFLSALLLVCPCRQWIMSDSYTLLLQAIGGAQYCQVAWLLLPGYHECRRTCYTGVLATT